ncbi:hypothetical protein ES288_A03G078800v1 [Gossypium darwinii]|uniref:Uncharacterized protein n=2 Tax=Gossypium TaxID=3633 RepID=A0A5D2R4V8_GOSTO|nr:hypothetical protein ES288_A03G078800v1 [Gossypium darwinii]TYI35473.1 hypothetical protein ES332_A03G078800v1 [Gossypium tomentosum]
MKMVKASTNAKEKSLLSSSLSFPFQLLEEYTVVFPKVPFRPHLCPVLHRPIKIPSSIFLLANGDTSPTRQICSTLRC